MSFVEYDSGLKDYSGNEYITKSWYSRNKIGILSLLLEERMDTLHIVYSGDKGQLFIHVSPNGIIADGYTPKLNEQGIFTGKEPTDTSVLKKFKLTGLPDHIVSRYKKAVEFKDKIKPSSPI
ncbi:MAG: hypothetical protein HYW23_03060 [Candidatus Aenigmarchaeota archaeon]|nr:hypothetical protein [Candidatus Aenigmarchaeota archaeon]